MISTQILQSPIVHQIGWVLVHTVWQGTLVAAVLALILRIGRGSAPGARYGLCLASLASVVAVAVATFIALRPAEVIEIRTAVAIQLSDVDPVVVDRPLSAIQVQPTPWNADRALPWIVAAWIVGVVLLSIWQFGGWMLLRRYRATAMPIDGSWQQRFLKLAQSMSVRRATLALTGRIDVPIVIGVWRPAILMPIGLLNDLSVQQVEAILAHELAHVRRYDYLVNLIQAAIETLLFYHPAIWWIGKQIRLEREHCCDEMAAAVCGDRRAYAGALAALEESRAVRLAPAAGGGGRGELLNRIHRLLTAQPRGNRARSWSAVMFLAIVALAIPVSTRMLKAQATRPPAAPANVPQTAPSIASSPITPEDLVVAATDYEIVPNDLVQISVNDLVAPGVVTTLVKRVSESGAITVPLIDTVRVAGLTDAKVEQVIKQTYKQAGLLANAQVSVLVVESRGRTFSIMGAVARPGQYQIVSNDFRLLDAMVMAGGLEKWADIRVIRQTGDRDNPRMIDISGQSLATGDAKVNIVVRPRDFIVATLAQPQPFRIVVRPDQIQKDGLPTDWTQVRAALLALPESERKRTYIELSAGSKTLPVQAFFDAQAEAGRIVQELRLNHVSNAGVDPNASQVK